MRVALSIFVVLILSSTIFSQIPEYSNPFYLGGSQISGVKGFDVFDMDHDSDNDILIYTSEEIRWFENESGGSFKNFWPFFDLESPVVDIEHGDFDNNGKEDIALIQEAKPEELIVFWDSNSGDIGIPTRYQLETRGDNVEYASYAVLKAYKQDDEKDKLYLKYTNNTVTYGLEIIRELTFNEKELAEKLAIEGIDNDFYRSGGFEITEFNSDGILDFVISSNGGSGFSYDFFISNSDTSYSIVEAYFGDEYNTRYNILSDILIVDIDRDGFKDVITSTYSQIIGETGGPTIPKSYLIWYKNTDNSSFESGTPIDFLRGGYSEIYLYDVNQDGLDDLVAQTHPITKLTNPEGADELKTYWYERTEESGFGEKQELPGYYSQLEVADIDNDGTKDLAGLHYDELAWHKNEGTSIGNARSIVSSELYLSKTNGIPETYLPRTNRIKSEDLDGDNLNDIVTGSLNGIYWYKNLGDLKFSEIKEIDSEIKDVKQIQLMDINGNGLNDMIVLTSDFYSSELQGGVTNFRFYIFENTGNGFSEGKLLYEQPYSGEFSTNVIFSTGDYDNDADIDITFQSGNNIYWFANDEGFFPEEPSQVFSYDAESSSTVLRNQDMLSSQIDERGGYELLVIKSVRSEPPFFSYTTSVDIFSFSLDTGDFFKLQEVKMSNLDGYRFNLTIHVGNFDDDVEQEVLVSDNSLLSVGYSRLSDFPVIERSIIDKPQDSTFWNAFPMNSKRSSHLNGPNTGIITADLDKSGSSEVLSMNSKIVNVNLASPTSYSSGALQIHRINEELKLTNISIVDTLRDGYTSLTTSDLNNDGYLEIIAGLYNDGRIAIYGGNEAFPAVSNENEPNSIPEKVTLSQNYPNPFNPTTTINYSVPNAGTVELKVYNLLGQLVQTLVDGRKMSGAHQVQFDASALASGVYIYRLQIGNTVLNRKMVLIK